MRSKLLRLNRWLNQRGFKNEAADCIILEKEAMARSKAPIRRPLVREDIVYEIGDKVPLGVKWGPQGSGYVYILKLKNEIDEKQVQHNDLKTGPIAIHNWYVGRSTHPIRRFLQHKAKKIYLSDKAIKELQVFWDLPLDWAESLFYIEKFVQKIIENSNEYLSLGKHIFNKSDIEEGIEEGFKNPEMRCGAKWTTANPPLESGGVAWVAMVLKEGENESEYKGKVDREENRITEILREHYGEAHVKGGSTCQFEDPISDEARRRPYLKLEEFNFDSLLTQDLKRVKELKEQMMFEYEYDVKEIIPAWPSGLAENIRKFIRKRLIDIFKPVEDLELNNDPFNFRNLGEDLINE